MSIFAIRHAAIGVRAARSSVLGAPRIFNFVNMKVSARTYTTELGSQAAFRYSTFPFARLSVLAAVAAVGVGTSDFFGKPIECQREQEHCLSTALFF